LNGSTGSGNFARARSTLRRVMTWIVGINDRVTALGGRLTIKSPPHGGTVVDAALPFPH
jgi:signal transduction histidine kinase